MNEAIEQAAQLADVWAHLPESERIDQIEWHMQSDGFSDVEIAIAIDELSF